ncbi:hypothetical protein RCC89_20580 [Cytophagaceae bacterium ABcell3]|nr:hypothetical protein RCC89_20580 [Cytophagaceae bacterium ABcell3]
MRVAVIIFVCFIPFATFAHQDLNIFFNKNDVHLVLKTGWAEFEIKQKANILLHLIDNLKNKAEYSGEKVFVYFNHDYTYSDSATYSLGYGAFTYFDESKSGEDTATGIKVFIKERTIDIPKVLYLINSAFERVEDIKKEQRAFFFDKKYRFESIPLEKVLNFQQYNKLVEELLSEKTYRFINPSEERLAIDYFYSQRCFNFYVPSNKEGDEELVVLEIPHIHEILGDSQYGYFIFSNDSTFYFLSSYEKKAKGPYVVTGLWGTRAPVENIIYDHSPEKRFTFFFTNYVDSRKVMFVPGKDLVISDFKSTEDEFIASLISKEEGGYSDMKLKEKTVSGWLIGLLIVSVLLNIAFIIKIKKS